MNIGAGLVAARMSEWWNAKRTTLSFGMLVIIYVGKVLAAVGVGVLLAPWLRSWAVGLIVAGVALDVIGKRRWLRR